MGAEEQADSLDEDEVVTVMEITEVIERGRKDNINILTLTQFISDNNNRITQM